MDVLAHDFHSLLWCYKTSDATMVALSTGTSSPAQSRSHPAVHPRSVPAGTSPLPTASCLHFLLAPSLHEDRTDYFKQSSHCGCSFQDEAEVKHSQVIALQPPLPAGFSWRAGVHPQGVPASCLLACSSCWRAAGGAGGRQGQAGRGVGPQQPLPTPEKGWRHSSTLPQALAWPSLPRAGKFGTFSYQSRMEQTFLARAR